MMALKRGYVAHKPRQDSWTPTDDAPVTTMRKAGHSCSEIGTRIGRTKDAVQKRTMKLGLAAYKPPNGDWTEEKLAYLKEKTEAGEMTFEQIGNELGVTKNAAIAKARRMGWQQGGGNRPPIRPRGPRPPGQAARRAPRPSDKASHRAKWATGIERQCAVAKAIEAERESAREPLPPFQPANPVSLLDRKSSQCAYIISADGTFPAVMCGDNVTGSTSWCRHHREIVYPPLPYRKATGRVAA
jgi:hypothetical protein